MVAGRRGSESRVIPVPPGLRSPLVIDESLNSRIATDLKLRGRDAVSVGELNLRGLQDPELLLRAFKLLPNCVFVTADNAMPAEHPEEIVLAMATLAIVSGRRPAAYEFRQEPWERETIHRWAHRMQEQKPQSVMRFGVSGPRPWTQRRHA